MVVPGIETIDVSSADTSLLGHSYYGSSQSVLDDLRLLLLRAIPADQRPGLNAVAELSGKYWGYGTAKTARRAEDSEVTYMSRHVAGCACSRPFIFPTGQAGR